MTAPERRLLIAVARALIAILERRERTGYSELVAALAVIETTEAGAKAYITGARPLNE